jgi:hypothetical protein
VLTDPALSPDRQLDLGQKLLEQDERGGHADPSPSFVTFGDDAVEA